MKHALIGAFTLFALPAAVEPQEIVRGDQAIDICHGFLTFDARLAMFSDTGWEQLEPSARGRAPIDDAYAFLGVVNHMSPRSNIAARWVSVLDLSRRAYRAKFRKRDTFFYRSAGFISPDGDVSVHVNEARLQPETRLVSCEIVGLNGDSLTRVSPFRKRNILGSFAQIDLRRQHAKKGYSWGELVLFDQPEIADFLPDAHPPAYGVTISTTLPANR